MANSNTGELKVTRQKALTMALKFITTRFKNITIPQLESEYGLSHTTLYRIRDKKAVSKSTEHYMRVFVRIISTKRHYAQLTGNDQLVTHIDHLLRDLMLVQNGVPTDAEIRLYEYKIRLVSQK